MINYGKFKNYYDFIDYGKTLKTDSEKLKFVTDYIKYYCEYDYTFLVLSFINDTGFYDIKYYYERVNPKGTYFENYQDCSQITHVMSLCELNTKSELYNKIVSELNLTDLTQETLDLNLLKLKRIACIELLPYFYNYDLLEYYVDEFIKKLKEELSKTFFNDRMNKYVKTIEVALIQMCNDIHSVCKREYHNGLITKGVCEGFSDFIVRTLEDLDVSCVKIASNNHAWNLAKINNEYVMIDSTNTIETGEMVFCSYNGGIITKNEEETKNMFNVDWCNLSIKELFKLCPDRKITEIGNFILEKDEIITKDNYDNPKILEVLNNCFEEDVKIRKKEKEKALNFKNK